MTIYAKPGEFLSFAHVPIAMTAVELDIPRHDFGAAPSQPIAMDVDEKYMIFAPGNKKVGHYSLRSWDSDDHRAALATMVNVFGGGVLVLTNNQLVALEQQGRLKPYKSSGDTLNAGQALSLTDFQEARAKYWLGFVTDIKDAEEKRGRPADKALILNVAKDRVERLGLSNVPSYNQLRLKLDIYNDTAYDPLVALAPAIPKGNTLLKFTPAVENLIEDCVLIVSTQTEGDWDDVKTMFLQLAALEENEVVAKECFAADGEYRGPSDSLFQRRWSKVDDYVKDANRYGPNYAQRKHSIYIRQVLPDNVLDVVDVDWTRADITVIDDVYPVFWDRPWLCTLRDRCSAAVIGYSISFEGPSYLSLLAALRHAIYPKDTSAFPGLRYDQYGLMAKLGVDLAMENLSENMRNAAAQLGFQIVEYRGAHGWEKGGIERTFRTINQDVLHVAPGSTFSNPQRRKEYDDARMAGVPVLTLGELDAWVMTYIPTKLHTRPVKGIGVLRSMKAIPNEVWARSIANAPKRRPVDPLIFARLGGDVSWRTIQKDGILLEGLRYAAPSLVVMTSDPGHRDADDRAGTTQYKVIRDPNCIDRIWVVNHHVNPPAFVEVPVSGADEAYAKGMTLFRHRAIQKLYREKLKDETASSTNLLVLRETVTDEIRALNARREKMMVRHSFQRFFGALKRKFSRSRIVDVVHSEAASSERIRYDEPFEPAEVRRSPVDPERGGASTPPIIYAVPDGAADDGFSAPQATDPISGREDDLAPRPRRETVAPPPLDDRTESEATTSAEDLFAKFHTAGDEE